MSTDQQGERQGQGGYGPGLHLPVVTLVILLVCFAIEGTLVLADIGVIDRPRLRLLAYEFGGFWPGLLQDWQPNYRAQPPLMFLTYGFLHGGPVHFAINMLTLVSLGNVVNLRVGAVAYAVIYCASILGGALVFGLLAPTLQPMVGASGALFGLAGAILAWQFADSRAAGQSLVGAWILAAFLLGLNLVMWWAMDGQLAWQTHLGGFLTGLALGAWYTRR
ncbi:MAG: rhomboid family intramembrane serine protease [Rhodobacteraceae bacterium]|nr:rhomboid family intramembrane serine protease [Alphaproteobacteria bacterium]NNK66991.1 rhomboid family intramembrane serine protease [Paracoccaceae bacterium]